MNKIINIPQGNGNFITEIELPFYVSIHKFMHVALRGTAQDRIRRVFVDSLHGEISFKDFAALHELDIKDIQNALKLCEGYKIIQEREFLNHLSQTIENINA